MRISDWSSDVCSSDLSGRHQLGQGPCLVMVVIGFSSIKLSLLAPGTKRVEFQFGDIPDGLMQADQPTSQIASRIDGPRANQVRGVITQIGRASCRERVCQYV